MPAVLDLEHALGRHRRPDQAVQLRQLRERHEHVKLAQPRICRTHLHAIRFETVAQRAEHLTLQLVLPGFGGEHFMLHLLQLGRHETFAVNRALLPDVGGRHLAQVGLRHLDEEPLDVVEPALERADAGALPLLRLQTGDPRTAGPPQIPQVIHGLAGAVAENAALLGVRRRGIDEIGQQLPGQFGGHHQRLGDLVKQRGGCRRGIHSREQPAQAGKLGKRVAQRPELARRRDVQLYASRDPLQIGDILHAIRQLAAFIRLAAQHLDSIMAAGDGRQIGGGIQQPIPQRPRSADRACHVHAGE